MVQRLPPGLFTEVGRHKGRKCWKGNARWAEVTTDRESVCEDSRLAILLARQMNAEKKRDSLG